MKKLPVDFLTVARDAEYIFRGDDAIVIVSSGRVLTLTTRLSKETSALIIVERREGSSFDTVLFEGSASATMQAFLDIRGKIGRPQKRSVLATVQSLSVSAAALAIAVALSLFVIETRQTSYVPSAIEQTVPGPGLPDELDMPQEIDPPNAPEIGDISAVVPELRVLQKPDFLSSVEGSGTKAAGSKAGADGRKASISDTVAAIGLPVITSPAEQSAQISANDRPSPQPSNPTKSTVEPSPPDGSTATSVAETTSEPSDVATTDQGSSATRSASDDVADPAVGKNAQDAMKKLIGDGMTEDQIRKLLVDLQSLKAGSADGITPEMLQALPEEVAALLADQGMELEGPGGGTMNILPSEVVDQYRGKDGVATIPENHSWYARSGGPVSIPLPGGGDIKEPDDLKDFGLQP